MRYRVNGAHLAACGAYRGVVLLCGFKFCGARIRDVRKNMMAVVLTSSDGGGRGSRGKSEIEWDMEAFGHDLARADRTPVGIEGDVDRIHGVEEGIGPWEILPGQII